MRMVYRELSVTKFLAGRRYFYLKGMNELIDKWCLVPEPVNITSVW